MYVEYDTLNVSLIRHNCNEYHRVGNKCSNYYDNVLPDYRFRYGTGPPNKYTVRSNSILSSVDSVLPSLLIGGTK